MFFSLHNPGIAITTYVIQLVAYPIGLVWDLLFPDRVWEVLGVRFNFKPGKFNVKEHVVIVAMSNVRLMNAFPSCYDLIKNLYGSWLFRQPTVVASCMPPMSCLRNRSSVRCMHTIHAGPY